VTWDIGGCFDCENCFDPDCFECFSEDDYIKVMKEEVSLREVEVGDTRLTQRMVKFFTYEDVKKYDRILYPADGGELYEVESVTPFYYLLGDKAFQHAVMIQRSYYGDW